MLSTKCLLSSDSEAFILRSREKVADMLTAKEEKRLLLILGPCSIHDVDATLEYAKNIQKLRATYGDKIEILMRVYLEKPRSVLGWKGFINDPYLDGSCNIKEGILLSRKLMREITALQIPIATEILDNIVPQYISDFVTWGAIGARTVESQIHREVVSGASMPVGFKNGTNRRCDCGSQCHAILK